MDGSGRRRDQRVEVTQASRHPAPPQVSAPCLPHFVPVSFLRGCSSRANFFDLGGHSLVAVRLVARIQAALDIDLALRAVFDTPTLRGMAEVLGRAGPSPAPEGSIAALERRRYRLPADAGSMPEAIRRRFGAGAAGLRPQETL
jgi:Phosphopantetheine attachment site